MQRLIINRIAAERAARSLSLAVNPRPEMGAIGGVSSATRGVLVEHRALGKVITQPRSSPGAPVDFPSCKNRFTTDKLSAAASSKMMAAR